jgi:3-dehydroquinate synthase
LKSVKQTLQVDLGDRSYPIYIGPAILDNASLYQRHIAGKQVLVVTNETVAPLYLQRLLTALDGFDLSHVILPDGEQYKTLDVWSQIIDELLARRFSRGCTLIALGGGVIGDMTGFAAASYQRGVDFIQVPTTLLSQVDSSVGGKTGVNHVLGKNMIGAFHQPKCVIADTASLNTLDDRQLSSGIAEVVKYGLIGDLPFFEWLEENVSKLLSRDTPALVYAIARSCQDKADIVSADEREVGQRALLNLGHTFGHAIETGMGYGEWLHGDAVAAGMAIASKLSCRLNWMDRAAERRVVKLLKQAQLPVDPPLTLSPERMMSLMSIDKKVMDGNLRLVLLKGIGNALVTDQFETLDIVQTLNEYIQ